MWARVCVWQDIFSKGASEIVGIPPILHAVLGVGPDGVIVPAVLAANYVVAVR